MSLPDSRRADPRSSDELWDDGALAPTIAGVDKAFPQSIALRAQKLPQWPTPETGTPALPSRGPPARCLACDLSTPNRPDHVLRPYSPSAYNLRLRYCGDRERSNGRFVRWCGGANQDRLQHRAERRAFSQRQGLRYLYRPQVYLNRNWRSNCGALATSLSYGAGSNTTDDTHAWRCTLCSDTST
jgi:hypothetical protein